MSIDFDAVSSTTGTVSSTITWAHVVGNGYNRGLIVGVAAQDVTVNTDFVVTGIKYNNVAMTYAIAINSTTSPYVRCELWYIMEPNIPISGSYNIVVTFNGTVDSFVAGGISVFGIKNAAPTSTNTQSISNAQVNTTITPVTLEAWVFDVISLRYVAGQTEPILSDAAIGQRIRWSLGSGGAGVLGGMSTKSTSIINTATSLGWGSNKTSRKIHSLAVFSPAVPVQSIFDC